MNTATAPLEIRRIVQITDLHLGDNQDYQLAGINTCRSFEEVLSRVQAETIPLHMVVVTGDIAAQGVLPAYRLFADRIKATGLPYAWLPGNHDDFGVMQESVNSAPYWPVLELGGWQLISLNTAEPGKVAGRLERGELDFLRRVLTGNPHTPTAIFMHHPPWAIGCAWLDRQRVANAGALRAIIEEAANVKAIFSGHVHQDFAGQWAGIPVYCTPSSCFQFAAGSDHFRLSASPPAYRWIDLCSNGSLQTGVVQVNSEQKVDTSSTGY